MTMTYKTVAGTITLPGSDIGVRAKVRAVPLTTATALTFTDDDRLSIGPVAVETPGTGALPAAFKVPTNTDVGGELYWRIEAELIDRIAGAPKKWTVKHSVQITGTGTVQLRDLAEVDTIAVDAQILVNLSDLVDDAENARDDAESAALDAEDHKDAAAASASTATTAAGTATTQAGVATTQAGIATTKAGQAATSADEADASADAAAADLATVEGLVGAAEAVAVANDTIIAGRINDPESDTSAALAASYVRISARPVSAFDYGVVPDGTTKNDELDAAFAAADALGGRTQVHLPDGEIRVAGSWSGTGYSSGPVGTRNTTVQAVAQTGPVLDLTGVNYDLNDIEIGNFRIKGDGTAGSAKKGIAFDPDTSFVRGWVHDIIVEDTGGAPFDLGYSEMTVFERLIAWEPVSAAANDIPYFTAAGAFNGNKLRDCQMHGKSAGASVGASGAMVIKDNGLTAPHTNKIDGLLCEYLHLPTDGEIISIAGNGITLSDLQFFDCSKVSGATNTAHVRFLVPGAGNLGANLVLGPISGRGTNLTDIDWGVDVYQDGNRILGTKGYRGYNVRLNTGVQRTYIDIGGRVASATDPTVVDDSGQTNNTILDRYGATEKRPATTYQQGANSAVMDLPGGAWGQGSPRFSDPSTPVNGGVGLGTSGTRIQALGAAALFTADEVTFRRIDLTPNVVVKFGAGGPRIIIGSGSPEGVVTASVASEFKRTDGGAGTTHYFKESGTGNIGWVAK